MAINESDLAALDVAATRAKDFRRRMATADATPTADYDTIHARFDRPAPEEGFDASAVIEELVTGAEEGMRGLVAPRFYAWVNGSSHLAGVAADWLTSAWGQNCAGVPMSPAAAAVEAVAARWLLELLDLSPECSVGFVTGATVANFVGLAAARNEQLRKAGWNVEDDGLFGAPPVSVVIGADAHSTVFQALRYVGFGAKRVRTVATDSFGRMLVSDFERALKEADGPVVAIGQAGQINTGVSDPFAEIVPLVRQTDGWLHVDGAFGLWANASKRHRHLLEGVELADSWATDGHKWLQTPYDCGFAICRNEAAHRRAMDLTASYLAPAGSHQRHPGAYVPELSRRARGFATWAMIRRLGRNGIAQMVDEDVRLAKLMAASLAEIDGVEVVNQPELNQFVVLFGADRGADEGDRLTLATIERIQQDAVAYLGSSLWHDRWVMRVSVCSIQTTEDDALLTVQAIKDAWQAVQDAT